MLSKNPHHRDEFNKAQGLYNTASPADDLQAATILINMLTYPDLSLFRRAWVNALLVATANTMENQDIKEYFDQALLLVAELRQMAPEMKWGVEDLKKIRGVEEFAESALALEEVKNRKIEEGKRVVLPVVPGFDELEVRDGEVGVSKEVEDLENDVKSLTMGTLLESPEKHIEDTYHRGDTDDSLSLYLEEQAKLTIENGAEMPQDLHSIPDDEVSCPGSPSSSLHEVGFQYSGLPDSPHYGILPIILPLIPHPPAQRPKRAKEIWQRLEALEYFGEDDQVLARAVYEAEDDIMRQLENVEEERNRPSSPSTTQADFVPHLSPSCPLTSPASNSEVGIDDMEYLTQKLPKILDDAQGQDLVPLLQSLTRQVLDRTRKEVPETESTISMFKPVLISMLEAIQKEIIKEITLKTVKNKKSVTEELDGSESSTKMIEEDCF